MTDPYRPGLQKFYWLIVSQKMSHSPDTPYKAPEIPLKSLRNPIQDLGGPMVMCVDTIYRENTKNQI